MPSEKPSTMTRLSWAKAASSAPPISASDHTLLIPTEEPSRAGLTNTGVPSTVSSWRTASGSRAPAVLANGGGGHLRHGRGGQHLLEHDLVHAQRGGQHAGADVGHVEQLEQALDGAVLAERPVQDGEHGVGAEQARRRG